MDTRSRIALIDDDRAWLETLSTYLRDRGYDVFTTDEGSRGLDVLEANDLRLAVIDFHMPGMDGLELLRQLRQRRRRVTTLMLSSDDDPSLPVRALADGALAFLSKTTAPGVLLRTLVQTLAAAEQVLWLPAVIRRDLLLPVLLPSRHPRRL
jgi:DNA-binding response OmpR family regulator